MSLGWQSHATVLDGRQLCQKELQDPGGRQLYPSSVSLQQGRPKCVLGFLSKKEANRSREIVLALYSALVRWRTGSSMSVFFTVTAVKYWNRLPRGVVDIQSLFEQDTEHPDPRRPALSRALDHIRGPFQRV